MVRGACLLVLTAGLGCAAAGPPPEPRQDPIVEWHASERAYQLEPLCEDVVVWADGRIETSKGKRVVLNPLQMERLFVLLSRVDFLQVDGLDDSPLACPGPPRDPDIIRGVLLVYSPRPGVKRELRRSWGDGSLEELAFPPECYSRLESLDAFFRGLLWKD